MSERNGEKAKFNIQRKKRLLRRKRNRELRKALESSTGDLRKKGSQSKEEIAVQTLENEGSKE